MKPYDWLQHKPRNSPYLRTKVTNANLRLVELADRKYINCVRYNAANGWLHEMKKAAVCLNLQKNGHEYICEARFADGSGRADVFVLDIAGGMVYEILNSETQEKFQRKAYPVRRIIPIEAKGNWPTEENDNI